MYSTTLQVTTSGGSAEVAVTLVYASRAAAQLVIGGEVAPLGAVDRYARVRLENRGASSVHWEVASAPAFLSPSVAAGEVAGMR